MRVHIGRYQKDTDPQDWERTEKIHINKWDMWNLDHTLASIIHPALVMFKETKHGYPQEYSEECGGKGWDDWAIVLDKMIWSFKGILEDNYLERIYGESNESWKARLLEHEERTQEGLLLFGKWFQALWT